MEQVHVIHPFPALFDAESQILILGSFPSIKSRESNFFYGHPQNRFWTVLSQLFHESCPVSIDQKRDMLLRHHVALWDVIYACDIIGSSDSSIRNAIPTNLQDILANSKITRIFCNGQKSGAMYKKYQEKTLSLPALVLPSTSPANAAWSVDRLTDAWSVILEALS